MKYIENLQLAQVIVGEAHGGAERFFVKLAIALHHIGLRQNLFIGRDQQRYEALSDAGLDVQQYDFGKGPRGWFETRRFQKALFATEPNIVVAWMNRAARRIPQGNYKRIARFGGYYPLKYYEGFDCIVCNTPDLAKHVVNNNWKPDRVEMISNFGELPVVKPVSRAEFDTSEDAIVLLASGRFHHSKGFDTLLKAVAHVPDAVLWLAGAGELESVLRKLSAELGVEERVRFVGWRDDQAAFYQACDICVVPSRHEPLSNVVVEAWSQKVPVIATASEGPSWLLQDEKSGLLTPVDDVEKLANAINRLVAKPEIRRQYALSGFRKWEDAFSREAIVDQYVELFQKMVR